MDTRYDVLENRWLRVEIEKPGTFYNGPRFDWSGRIAQIFLNGQHRFLQPGETPESLISGASGLCGEFGLSRWPDFKDIPVGGHVPKIGVGMLQKTRDEPWSENGSYPVRPFRMEVSASMDRIRYRIFGTAPDGYSFELDKMILLHEKSLLYEMRLINTGTQPLDTQESMHCFLAVDQLPIGSGYELRLPVTPETDSGQPPMIWDGSTLRFSRAVVEPFSMHGSLPAQPLYNAGWTLLHRDTGLGISGSLEAKLQRLDLHGSPTSISPELVVGIHAEPGQTQQWKRRFSILTVD